MKTNIIKILALFIIITSLISGCSVVFTSSITGSLADVESYDNGDAGSGIADAEVYLYTDIDKRDADYDAWVANAAALPDIPAEGEPEYFLKTITDAQGDYTFNGFIWNELFPDYGKSGDRKEIFMLFYHNDYGMNKTAYPVYVVSDVTNRIPLFKLKKILNTAEIAGNITDAETGDPLINANIRIWVPTSWSYTTDGSIDTDESSSAKFSWDDTPSFTALSDDLGNWIQNISYKMLPSASTNNGTTILRITYASNGYIAENAADSDITDGGWDRDGNGTIDSDEDEGYFQSGEIITGSYTELEDIALADEFNAAVVSGRVVNSSTSDGEPNVSVRIYVAEDWSYNSADPTDIEAAATVTWSENPSYTLNTDAAGDYSQNIRFERKPSEADNRLTTRVRLVFVKNSFLIDSTTDAGLTDGGWDRDGNITIDADEDDAFFDPPTVIDADLDNDLGSIVIKQTEFTETLSGEVWADTDADAGTPNVLANGVEVWLFYNPVDHDANPATALETVGLGVDNAPDTGDSPDFTDITSSILVTQDTVEKGHFSFNGLEWTDTGYTGNQSKASFWIYIPTDGERTSGQLAGSLALIDDKYYLTAGSTNYVSLTQ